MFDTLAWPVCRDGHDGPHEIRQVPPPHRWAIYCGTCRTWVKWLGHSGPLWLQASAEIRTAATGGELRLTE